MPTAQSTTTQSNKVGNKIAKAVAKVEQNQTTNTNQQDPSTASASAGASTTGNKTPQDQPEFIKQSLIIIEKKVRNLEKRRSKLDEYKESQRKGAQLNEDQLLAVSKYDEVIRSLELARELEKQFVSLANDAMKQQKKQAKKEQSEREEAIKERLRESHKVSSVLNIFADESVRNDFLNETNGAIRLTQQELNMLDELHKLLQPSELGSRFEQSVSESADHLLNLIEGKNKPITSFNQELTGQVTFNDVKKLIERIYSSSYWNKEQEQQLQQTETEPQQQVEQEQENLQQQLNNLNLNEQQNQQVETQLDQQNHHHQQQQHQVYQQQNTSDDYVLVNSNDFDNSQVQQQQTKAFFSTLNPTGNINEFLQNNGEGINFLQDSEIQLRQQQEQQQLQQTENFSQQQTNQQGNNYQQFEGQRENRGGRGGHREFNGNRNYDQRRNYEQRRSGGGNYQPRGDNNGPRNGGSGGNYRGGNRGGYRGGYSNSGPRTGSGGNQYPRQPRNQEHHQQPVAQN